MTTNKILFYAMDEFPPQRPDVDILIGEELPKYSWKIDYVGKLCLSVSQKKPQSWKGGAVILEAGMYEIGIRGLISRVFDKLRVTFYTAGKIVKKQYQIVLVKDKFVSAILPMSVSILSGVPFVFWLSYPYPEHAKEEYKKNSCGKIKGWIKAQVFHLLLYKIIIRNVDHLFVQSEAMAHFFVLKNIPGDKITCLPMAVSPDAIKKALQRPLLRNTNKTILYLGSLDPEREIEFIIDVFSELIKIIPDTILNLVGEAREKRDLKTLENYIEKLGLTNKILITGQLPREEAWDYVRAADVCLSPIPATPVFNVSFPTKCVEYMALGKAVVANDIPSQKQLISESNGGICVDYTRKGFEDAIVKLLQNTNLAESMGRKGQKYILSSYTYDRIGKILAEKIFFLIK